MRSGLMTGMVFAIFAAGASLDAGAVEVTRQDFQGAAGLCKAATPAYAAQLRTRPLAMDNTSGSPVYLTCNWQGDDTQNGTRGATSVFVVVGNSAATPQTVACTLVNGFQSGALLNASYTPKTVVVPAGGSARIEWVPGDIPGAPARINLPAASCMLPGGTSLHYTGKVYNEDVGA